MSDPFALVPCKGCGKDVFPSERLNALKSIWHKQCLKCTTCGVVLNTGSLESYQMVPYCKAHVVQAKTGGGIQTAYGGAAGAQKVASNTQKNWDPNADIAAARNTGYSTGPTEAPGTNYQKANPQADISAARTSGFSHERSGTATSGTAYQKSNPQADIAAARSSGFSHESSGSATTGTNYQKAQIVGGNVGAAKGAFTAKPAAAEPKPAAAPKKPTAKFGAAAAPAAKPAATPAKPAASKPAAFKPVAKMPPPAMRAPEPVEEPSWDAPAAPAPEPSYDAEPSYNEEPTYEQQDNSGGWDEPPQPPAFEPPQEPSYDQGGYDQDQGQGYDQGGYDQGAGGATCTALYDYAGEVETDLPFSAGDIITVIEQGEDGWWKGELNGYQGSFPSNFVQLN